MDGRDLHVGDLDWGVLPPAAPLAIATQTLVGLALRVEAARRGRASACVVHRRGRQRASASGTRRSTSRRCRSCRWSSSSRTTSGRSAPTSASRPRRGAFALRAAGYGMPGVDALRQRPGRGRGRRAPGRPSARAPGAGPALLELMTYRRTGHAHHDDDRFLGNPEAKIAGYEHEAERRALGGRRSDRALRGAAGGDGHRVARAARRAARRGAGGGRRCRPRGGGGAVADAGRLPPPRLRGARRCRAFAGCAAAHPHDGLRRGGAPGDLEAMGATSGSSCSARTSAAATAAPSASPAGSPSTFGDARCVNMPIAESAIVGCAVGAALAGLRPVVEMQFADFLASGFNALVNNAAKLHWRWGRAVPMVRPPALRRRHRHRPAPARRRPVPQPVPRDVVPAHARLEDRRSVDAGRRQRPHARRHPRQQPGGLPRGQGPLRLLPHRPARGGAARRRTRGRDRPRRGAARGWRPDDPHLRLDGLDVVGGGGTIG